METIEELKSKGWPSPDEAKRLEADCAAMREALEMCKPRVAIYSDPLPDIVDLALSNTSGKDLLDRLQKAEALLRDSANVYNPWWCERRDAFLAEQKHE